MNTDKRLELTDLAYDFYKTSRSSGKDITLVIFWDSITVDYNNGEIHSTCYINLDGNFDEQKEILLKKITDLINIYFQL